MRYLPIVLIACAVVVSGCSRPQEPGTQAPTVESTPDTEPAAAERELTSTITLSGPGLRLDAPEGWGFVRDPEYVDAECVPEDADGDLPVILVQTQSVRTDLSMEAIVSGFSRQLPKGIEDLEIVKDEAVQVKGPDVEAYEVGYNGSVEGEQVRGSQVLMKKQNWLVVATLMSAPDEHEQTGAVFQSFIQAIRWD